MVVVVCRGLPDQRGVSGLAIGSRHAPEGISFQARRPVARHLFCGCGDCLRTQAAPGSFARSTGYFARRLWMNVACHVVATQSERLLDAPFTRGSIPEGQQLRPGAGRRVAGQRQALRSGSPTRRHRSSDRAFELPHADQCDGNGNSALAAHGAPVRHSSVRSRRPEGNQ